MPKSNPKHANSTSPLTYYPAYCYPLSKTWNTWVKLTAHDIYHRLHSRPDAPPLALTTSSDKPPFPTLFYLNHPIQFVQVTGIIVTLEDYFNDKLIFNLDDSSGATIEIVWRKPKPLQQQQPLGANGATTITSHVSNEDHEAEGKEGEETSADDLHIHTLLPTLALGTTVRAKCTLSTYRGVRQLRLHRVDAPLTTMTELSHIRARSNYLRDVLGQPWVVDRADQQRLLEESQDGSGGKESERAARARRRREMMQQRELRHAQTVQREWEEEEKRRMEEAEVAREAGEQLKRKDVSKS